MNLEDVHLAVIIGREGSLTAASARLGIAPGTLSKALARLERTTKVKLFERLPRGMRPTELGAAFLARASRIDLAADELRAELRDLRQARAGVLRFGVGQGIANRWVRPVVAALVERGVSVELAGGMTDSLGRAVRLGELEFAVFGLSKPPGDGLAWRVLVDDPMRPMAPRGHPLAQPGRRVAWSTLARARWITNGRETSTFAEFEANFAAHGLATPVPAVISRSSQRERVLALSLQALVLMPSSALHEPDVREQMARVAPAGGWRSERRLGIATRESGYLSPAALLAMSRLEETIRATATPRSP